MVQRVEVYLPHHVDFRDELSRTYLEHAVVFLSAFLFFYFLSHLGICFFGFDGSRFVGSRGCFRAYGLGGFRFVLGLGSPSGFLRSRLLGSLLLLGLFGYVFLYSLLDDGLCRLLASVEGIEIDFPHGLEFRAHVLGHDGLDHLILFGFPFGLFLGLVETVDGDGGTASTFLALSFLAEFLRLDAQLLVLAELLYEEFVLLFRNLRIRGGLHLESFLLEEFDNRRQSYV